MEGELCSLALEQRKVPTQLLKAVQIQNNKCSEICYFLSHVELILVQHEDSDATFLPDFLLFSLFIPGLKKIGNCSAIQWKEHGTLS